MVSVRKFLLKMIAIGAMFVFIFGGALVNIIYHDSIELLMSPAINVIYGFITTGVLLILAALAIEVYCSKKIAAKRALKRSIQNEEYARKEKWNRIFETVLNI